jgi:phenylpropionate dioxygenase-like ring-hydroxylating dioxygenase large terminal subunit
MELLGGLWHLAAPSRALVRGRMIRRILWGEPVVLGRTAAGAAFALRDVCPHRAAPLSKGRLFDGAGGALVECPYHGWRFQAADGACAGVPALAEGSNASPAGVSVRAFALAEANGLVWIYRSEPGREAAPPETPPPDIGLPGAFRPGIIVRAGAQGPYDEAVIGLVDPAHTPFVHRQWWWREGAGLKEKSKTFEPTALGFKMPAHRPSSNSRIYKLLGGAPTTEIEFRLPGLRLETIRAGRRTILGLTAITPTEAGEADIHHVIFWDMPLLTLLKPVTQGMAENFLAQDGAILRAQNLNLARAAHRPLYLGDPDEPAKWYLRLKRAWAARAPGAPFVNPLAGTTLRWRT